MIGDDDDIRQFHKDLQWADTKHVLANFGLGVLVIGLLVLVGYMWFGLIAPNF